MGHHVYIGNNRGVEYSRGHVSLDPVLDAEEYYKFSFHEMAYDVYAQVEKLYESAGGKNKVVYLSFYQGTV